MTGAAEAGLVPGGEAAARVDIAAAPPLPWRTRLAIYTRLLAVQGSFNYELLIGTGIGFSVEPALRLLPEGRQGAPYRDALARESRYFNAHPYLTAVAVGALARAELDREPPARIERFRTALCGPLGSLGDRLVWAGWLPLCALLALAVAALGLSPLRTILFFLVLYNVGHLGLRAWGLRAGWRSGLRVASALGNPVFRHGPAWVTRGVALAGGFALPLALQRVLASVDGGASPAGAHSRGESLLLPTLAAAVLGTLLLIRLPARAEGWRLALVALALLVLITIIRS